jgi:pyridoxamine 5'-phosphate oxidase
VRVEGTVTQLPEDESDAYFASRPRGHQLSAWASEQGEPVEGRAILDERLEHFAARFEDGDVPRPHSWGGYLIAPERFEFWQGRPNRMHDRIEYLRTRQGWTIRRLQP